MAMERLCGNVMPVWRCEADVAMECLCGNARLCGYGTPMWQCDAYVAFNCVRSLFLACEKIFYMGACV